MVQREGDRPVTTPHVPRVAELLLRLMTARWIREAFMGDLEEGFGRLASSSVHEARRWYWKQALRSLNPLARVRRPRSGRRRRKRWPGDLGKDVRVAFRTLVRQPGFMVVAVLTLALGIGGNTAIFSVVNGVLLKPLPYPNPERLVNVWQVNSDWFDSPNVGLRSWARSFPVSMPVLRDWGELASMFHAVGGYSDHEVVIEGPDGRPTALWAERFTSGMWRALGVRPHLGRTFDRGDDRVGAERVAVLSYGFWEERYGGDSSVVGKTIHLVEPTLGDSAVAFTVVGVMPRGFYFPDHKPLWINFDDVSKQLGWNSQFMGALARLEDGISLESAQREMERVTEQMREARDGEHPFGVRLESRLEAVVGDVRLVLLVLLGAVGLVLLIACANITNLLLVKATERRRELALRTALGAGRSRLMRQLMAESLVLSLLGGLAGVGMAFGTFGTLVATLPGTLPRLDEVALDYRVLGFALGLSVFTGVVVGLLPGLKAARTQVSQVLKDGGRGSSPGRGRIVMQDLVVVSEVALAFVLFTAAGLLLTSFLRLTREERGFLSDRVLVFRYTAPTGIEASDAHRSEFAERLLERVRAVPGIEAAAVAQNVPFSGSSSSGTTTVETAEGPVETNVEVSGVSPDYFSVLGIPVLVGRSFEEADRPESEPVAVVSRSLAEEYWPGENPIGARLKRSALDSDAPWMRVVGVVEDVRHHGLHVDARSKLYRPWAQASRDRFQVVLKAGIAAPQVLEAIQQAVSEFAPTLPAPRARRLEELVYSSVEAPRFRTRLVSLMALLAGFLALLGIYGVLAYTMAHRTTEIGIRMALGARPAHVVGNVLGRAVLLAGTGLALGGVIAWLTFGVLESLLYRTSVHDSTIFLMGGALLVATALLASYLPALRAARTDPARALRVE